MKQLEQSMKDAIASHGFLCMHIAITDYEWRDAEDDERIAFEVSAQWRDGSQEHGRGIASGRGATIEEAMHDFTLNLVSKRTATFNLSDAAIPEVSA